ncbi:MAG TPA: MBOAT family O-acyltransferase [Nitrospirota bacterium]|nr:MBOAT family O-acyltransferase [Thermodesulfovibrionales bacterium]HXY61971.1 MBOAT family O-acyltransferase [Nitrospirota bacterium]
MVFSSPVFLFLFLPIVLTLVLIVPKLKARNALLLLSSLIFYAWGEPIFIFLALVSTLINYFLGLWVERSDDPARRKTAVTLAIALNIGLLAFFKYADFAVANVNSLLSKFHYRPMPLPHVLLPIGVSFFTFHALSYVIDIYRRKWKAANNPADVALYIFFFPQMIAGPILRWSAIAPQLARRVMTGTDFAEGVRRFVGGLTKKMVVANVVAVPARDIFALPSNELTTPVAWFGILCYTLQIYFDFSGYSDMAVGLGKMFGFEFLENFNFPYISQSIRDFWRRWHISLSTWFRDYLYIPLGGNRRSELRTYFNLIIVFFLCGLWHGASWPFVIWGLYHGLFLVLERTRFGSLVDKMPRPMRHLYALFVVTLGWVLFRSETLSQAMGFFNAMFGFCSASGATQPLARYVTRQVAWSIGLGILFSAPLWPWIRDRYGRLVEAAPESLQVPVFATGLFLETLLFVALLVISSAWLAGGTYNPFIYYRF